MVSCVILKERPSPHSPPVLDNLSLCYAVSSSHWCRCSLLWQWLSLLLWDTPSTLRPRAFAPDAPSGRTPSLGPHTGPSTPPGSLFIRHTLSEDLPTHPVQNAPDPNLRVSNVPARRKHAGAVRAVPSRVTGGTEGLTAGSVLDGPRVPMETVHRAGVQGQVYRSELGPSCRCAAPTAKAPIKRDPQP